MIFSLSLCLSLLLVAVALAGDAVAFVHIDWQQRGNDALNLFPFVPSTHLSCASDRVSLRFCVSFFCLLLFSPPIKMV